MLLLAWPLGKKGTKKPWGHLTIKEMGKPEYLRSLEKGNIGVALGEKSGGVCSIDFDDDALLERFLERNPVLSLSLRTRGARGGNVWLRCNGEYPASKKLKLTGGDAVGEWRANGNQTIISGRHPDGCDYQFIVEDEVLEIDFSEIVWPEELQPISRTKNEQLAIEHSHSGHTVAQTLKVGTKSPPLFDIGSFTPKRRGQSDSLLWAMARRVRTWEKQNDRQATRTERETLFDTWWPQARSNIDPSMDYIAFREKWLRACRDAKYCDDETPVSAAWKAVISQPLPPEALCSYGAEPLQEPMKQLIALCYHLQVAQRDKPFFLGSRDAGKLLKTSHTTVFYWLEALCDADGEFRILDKVSIGSQVSRKTNEYRYIPLSR